MSLEKKRKTKENKVEKELEGSSFRRLDFTPLQDPKIKKRKQVKDKDTTIEDLTEIEKDVL
ncbi:MAG: hypothetical protein KAW66_05760, partial [Candidatus Lokiarchaeota archaeon]|nr:hypothetical protein [Candidatus Lokiarchaeota archaeon]